MRSKLRHGSLTLLAIVPMILVRLAAVAVTIRFGHQPSMRIGSLAPKLEIYLCERDAGMHGRRSIDVFYDDEVVSNRALAQMWHRVVPFWSFARYLARVNRWLPGWERHVVPWRHYGDRDLHGVLARTAPHISFTDAEVRAARDGLRALGVPEGAPFVCAHARDAAYLDAAMPGIDWSYHGHRDVDIQTYVPALEELAASGTYVLRMGSVVARPLAARHPRIIDYATSGIRSDLLDVVLGASCRFFIGSTAGLYLVPVIFRRRVALTNWTSLEALPHASPDDLFIPKKLWLTRERRLLRFSEILGTPVGRFGTDEQYGRAGIELIDNTPEEVIELVREMIARLDGTWADQDDDAQLQERFWSLVPRSEINGVAWSRVGAAFLRAHRALLDR